MSNIPRARSAVGRLGALVALLANLLVPLAAPGAVAADPASPITVSTTDSPDPVASGGELTYTIAVVNTGGAKVDNLVLTDQLNGVGGIGVPPQLVLTSSQGSCSQSSLKVTCSGGSLGGGDSWTVTIRGQVTAASGTTINNTASVTGTKSAQNFTSTSTATTLVSGGSGSPLPDLTLSKTGPSSVVQESDFSYVLTVNNIGTANATDVLVVDTLPAGVTYLGHETTSLFTCTHSGTPTTVTCRGGAVNQGSNATITLKVKAPSGSGSIANTAVVDPNNTIAEANELNNTSSTVSTSVTSAPAPQGLTVTKTDSPDPVNPGQILTYTVVVSNQATIRADDVVVVDGTQGLEAASITASQVVSNGTVGNFGGCTVNAPQVRCSIRTLDPGGTLTVTIKGQVVGSAGSTIFNTATVTGNIRNQGVSATSSATTTVRPAVDLTITLADSPDPVCARSWPAPPAGTHLSLAPEGLDPAAGGSIPPLLAAPVCIGGLKYHMVVGNSGTADAAGILVRAPLPAGVLLDSYESTAGFTCAIAGGVVTCSGGSVPAASTRTLALLLVTPPSTGQITTTVTVDPNNAIFEADETNNTFTQTTQVTTGIDLVVWKGDSDPSDPPGNGAPSLAPQSSDGGFDPIATRGTQTYTIYVDNVGTQDVTGIKLRDALPADTVFLSVIADSSHGFTCSHDGAATGGIVECVGGHLLGTAAEFYDPAGPTGPAKGSDDFATIKIRLFARATVGTMHNEVRVDPDNAIAEVNELNNTATQSTTVKAGGAALSAYNELTVLKTQISPPTSTAVATNGTLVYDILVGNDATDPVQNVTVKDTLPSGARFIEAADTSNGPNAFTCSHAAGLVTCTGGSLSGLTGAIAGVPTSRTIRVKLFAPNTPGTYSNQAEVDPGNAIAEGNEFNNVSTVQTKVEVGGANMFNELTIAKTQSVPAAGTPVATSSDVVYNIVVGNAGSDAAFDVKVVDTLPAGFTYVEARDQAAPTDPLAFQCSSGDGNVVTCSGATINPGVNRTITVKALTSDQPGTYVNQALVDPDNTIPEGNETNNASQATTTVNVSAGNLDLRVGKTASSATVAPGEQIVYTLAVSNHGSHPAFNVKVRDDLPAGTTFISAADSAPGTAGAFTCAYTLGSSGTGGSVTCTNGTLDGSQDLGGAAPTSRSIVIRVTAPTDIVTDQNRGNVSAVVTNQAVIDPDNALAESDETNNSSPVVTTTVRAKNNLTLEKTGPTTASQNTEADYVITVHNKEAVAGEGGAQAFGVKVVDTLPVGLIPLSVSADPSNFLCSIEQNPVNVVTCVGDMNAGADVTTVITIHVFVTASSGTLDNEACVDPDGTITETNELDNCSHAISSVVPPAPDLLINQSASSGTVSAGQELTYTITVSNVGSGPTTGAVAITDNLPTAVTFVNHTATNGFTCSGTSTVSCSGASLNPGEFTQIQLLTTVNASGLPASFTNSASVSVDSAETNTANNGPVTVTTFVGSSGIDLQLVSISDTPDPVATSQALTWTIAATNGGTSAANGAVVRVNLPPAGITFVGASGTNGFNCSRSGTVVTCTGDFPAGGGTTITVDATVQSGAPPDLTLTATVDPANAFSETDEGNNSQTQVTTVSNATCTAPSCIDLVLTQLTGSPQPVKVGGAATFTFVVTNVGNTPTPANQAHIHFGVLNNFTGASIAVPTGWTCGDLTNTPGDREWVCDGTLLAGEGATFTITATATAGDPKRIRGTADVDPHNALAEFIETNNGPATFDVDVTP